VFVIDYQEQPTPTPPPHTHNIEPGYDTTFGPHRGVNIDVIRHITERETTQVRMIPYLHQKIEDLNMSFINLFVVQPRLFLFNIGLYPTLDTSKHFLLQMSKF